MRAVGWFVGVGLAMGVADGRAGVVAEGGELELVAEGFDFTEGPATNSAGEVFFTDQPNDRILRVGLDGEVSEFLSPSGRANGMFFDGTGDLWVCADAENELWRVSPAGEIEVVVRDFRGKRLNGPNDVWVRPSGGLYLTDPLYARDYWTRGPKEQPTEGVYFLPEGGSEMVLVDGSLKKPNGIVGSADGTTLYVADIGAKTIYSYRIEADGSLAEREFFCAHESDGLALDDEGNVYATGRDGVTIYGPDGELLETITVPRGWTANVTFGGANRDRLFITASKALYSIPMRVRDGSRP